MIYDDVCVMKLCIISHDKKNIIGGGGGGDDVDYYYC